MQRCEELALCTDEPGRVTRLFCTPAMRAAHDKLRCWIEAGGGTCRIDQSANLIGRFDLWPLNYPSHGGSGARPTLLIGSHIDSVVDAGRFDGALGILMGLALVEVASKLHLTLPFVVEVIAFSEEEGLRFSYPYIGSRGIVGELTEDDLQQRDANGITVAEALRNFGCRPSSPADVDYRQGDVIAYIEPHIEQGPLLETRNLAVGAVTGIAGQTRACLRFVGRAGHAGTVGMASRQDALAAAAEFILAVENVGREMAGLVATVGQINVAPNVANVIAGEVALRLDVRHASDLEREAAVRQILDHADRIANARNLSSQVLWINVKPATEFDAALVAKLVEAMQDAGQAACRLASGAGHDAAVMAGRYPTAMLFLRCAGGVSHHPEESVDESDVAIALQVLYRFVHGLASADEPARSPATVNN